VIFLSKMNNGGDRSVFDLWPRIADPEWKTIYRQQTYQWAEMICKQLEDKKRQVNERSKSEKCTLNVSTE
jgi:hypothetical protein